MTHNRVRLAALGLFLLSLPLTLFGGNQHDWFTDADGFQGYEVVFQWPALIPLGMWPVVPVVLSNAYVLVGMWLKRLPLYVHTAWWLMFVPATAVCIASAPARPGFMVLLCAWITSGIGPRAEAQEKTASHRPALPEQDR